MCFLKADLWVIDNAALQYKKFTDGLLFLINSLKYKNIFVPYKYKLFNGVRA